MSLKYEIIAVDFDGTVVDHRYPDVGPELPLAVDKLREAAKAGVKLILWTMRSGKELQDAVNWYKERGIDLFGVNKNPEQFLWTQSPKAFAHLYVDDAAFGAPLKQYAFMHRPGIDWTQVELVRPEFIDRWDGE
ncbi:MAG: hypothetical protein IPM06_18670 [Rhizobiales bacterium]|nr:hypothetical protein [Hyphomicrobiales bacterium]